MSVHQRHFTFRMSNTATSHTLIATFTKDTVYIQMLQLSQHVNVHKSSCVWEVYYSQTQLSLPYGREKEVLVLVLFFIPEVVQYIKHILIPWNIIKKWKNWYVLLGTILQLFISLLSLSISHLSVYNTSRTNTHCLIIGFPVSNCRKWKDTGVIRNVNDGSVKSVTLSQRA